MVNQSVYMVCSKDAVGSDLNVWVFPNSKSANLQFVKEFGNMCNRWEGVKEGISSVHGQLGKDESVRATWLHCETKEVEFLELKKIKMSEQVAVMME